MFAPRAIYATSILQAASLLGDGSLYVVLPVVYADRGLTPMDVGLILSANRWFRLLTNEPAALLLGRAPVRSCFMGALLLGGACSLVYGATRSLPALVAARCVWGGCWSVIRLTGMFTVTDVVAAGLAPEQIVGRMTGINAGVSRLGSAAGMAVGGFAYDCIGFSNLFYVAGLLTMLASPCACASATFGSLPGVSHTGSERARDAPRCALPRLTPIQGQLLALAFSASCAGNGLIVSTLGAIVASHALPSASGARVLALGGGATIGAASVCGLLIAIRWALEGAGAPLIGMAMDRWGWRRCTPLAFGLSCGNGLLGFALLRSAELLGGASASGVLLGCALLSVVVFFALASAADLCVKSMGVAWREAPLLVQGQDLGAAAGPVLGWGLLQAGLPPSSVLLAQATVHGGAALVAVAAAGAKSKSALLW